MVQIGKFGEFVEKAHARIYKTQTKDWMGQPELAGVKATLDKVLLSFQFGGADRRLLILLTIVFLF